MVGGGGADSGQGQRRRAPSLADAAAGHSVDACDILDWLVGINAISDAEMAVYRQTSGAATAALFQDGGAAIETLGESLTHLCAAPTRLEPVLAQLLQAYYRGGPLRLFALQFVPTIVLCYLISVGRRQRHTRSVLETFIAAVYNEEILCRPCSSSNTPDREVAPSLSSMARQRNVFMNIGSEKNLAEARAAAELRFAQKRVDHVRVPSIAVPSIYHDPGKISASVVGDSALLTRITPPSSSCADLRVAGAMVSTITIGPYPSFEVITAENRFLVLSRLIRSVNAHLAQMHYPSTAESLCLLAMHAAHAGFAFAHSKVVDDVLGAAGTKTPRIRLYKERFVNDFSSERRLPVASGFMLELMQGVYYSLFNGLADVAVHALDAVHQRAQYELFSDLLLTTNAVINSLLDNPSAAGAGPMFGVRVTTTSYEHSPVNKRHLVTNASLRIKRMPEDIPVKADGDGADATQQQPAKKEGGELAAAFKKRLNALRPDHIADAIKQSRGGEPNAADAGGGASPSHGSKIANIKGHLRGLRSIEKRRRPSEAPIAEAANEDQENTTQANSPASPAAPAAAAHMFGVGAAADRGEQPDEIELAHITLRDDGGEETLVAPAVPPATLQKHPSVTPAGVPSVEAFLTDNVVDTLAMSDSPLCHNGDADKDAAIVDREAAGNGAEQPRHWPAGAFRGITQPDASVDSFRYADSSGDNLSAPEVPQ